MNKRIQELAGQCESFGLWENKTYTFDKEKFAELIVRECANIANSGIDPAESHLIGNDILEHFGVKE
jgi:hypothetical protein